MSFSLIPENLRKPELIWEVASRGLEPAATVQCLREQLRTVMAVERRWCDDWEVTAELEACHTRMDEWEQELECEVTELSGSSKGRMATQLLHWSARLRLVRGRPEVSTEEVEWAKATYARLKDMLKRLGDGQTRQQNAASPEVRSDDDRSAVVLPTGAPLVVAAERQVVQAPAQFSAFAKLPHPMAATLQRMPQIDGLEVNQLIGFLEELFRLRSFPDMGDSMLMEVLIPFCLPPLKDRIMDCLGRRVGFDQFHAELIEYFIPARVMERLRVEKVYRPQAPGESLASFAGSIRGVAKILRVGLSEGQLVNIILEGIKPEERSRLVFCARPTSFLELDRLAIASRSVQDADAQRDQLVRAAQTVHQDMRGVRAIQDAPRPARGVCFRCGRPGHQARQCRWDGH